MVELDKLRITKLKCLSCGCRDKRIAVLKNKYSSERVGFSTICCNCGNIKTYIFRKTRKWKGNLLSNEDIVNQLNGMTHYVETIFCAIPIPFCPNKSCDLYGTCDAVHDITYSDLLEGKYPGEIHRIPERAKEVVTSNEEHYIEKDEPKKFR